MHPPHIGPLIEKIADVSSTNPTISVEIAPKSKRQGETLHVASPTVVRQQQDTRLPPGYFAPCNIVKEAFSKNGSVLCSKYSVFSSYFPTFPTFPKKLRNKVETIFQKKIQFETHSRKILPHVAILKNFKIQKKFKKFKRPVYFSEKKINFQRFENCFYSSRILRQICNNLVKK